MAKKLLATGYTVDAANDTIVVDTHVKHEELLLITDVDNNNILYNFADSSLGASSVTWDADAEETTIVLDVDMSAQSPAITNSTNIQIFVDRVAEKIDVDDSFLDPVHKIRVSTPENLIDTDFEYGLQPTKWETLERSLNVPSFFTPDGEVSLDIVQSVVAVNGSDVVTVNCSEQHGLVLGSPIDIQGVSQRTAEGKFLIKSVPTNTSFTYTAAGPMSVSGNIGTIYTTITPGTFYSGSQITYEDDTGIETDEAANSELTITTPRTHGFVEGSTFYLINTVGVKKLTMTATTTNAADGNPFVDDRQTKSLTPTVDLSKTETLAYVPVHHVKFDASAVSTASNTISWPNHRMFTGDTVVYIPPSGDTEIGGLDRFDFYYINRIDANTITLATSRGGSAINLTSTGTYNYGRGVLGLVYEMRYMSHSSGSTYAYMYTQAQQYNIGSNGGRSGWDMRYYYDSAAGGWGLSGSAQWNGGNIEKMIWASRDGTRLSHRRGSDYQSNLGVLYYVEEYSTNNKSGMVFGESTNTPNVYHPFEDGEYFGHSYYKDSFRSGIPQVGSSRGWFYMYSNRAGTTNTYFSDRNVFCMPMKLDPERDSFFSSNHGLVNGGSITFTKSAGDDIKILNGGGNYYVPQTPTASTLSAGTYQVEKVSNDRFRLQPSGGGVAYRINQATGTYSWSGTGDNPTKNTFFISAHGLATGDALGLSTTGTLPGTPSGSPTSIPGETVDGGTTAEEFQYWEDAWASAAATAGITFEPFVTASQFGETSNYLIWNNPRNGELNQYYYLPMNSGYSYASGTSFASFPGNIYRRPFDSSVHAGLAPLKNTTGNNTTIIGTQCTSNQSLDWYMNAMHVHKSSGGTQFADLQHFVYNWYYNQNAYSNTGYNSGVVYLQSSGNYYTSSQGQNWEGSILWSRLASTSASQDQYIVTMTLEKGTSSALQYDYVSIGSGGRYVYHNAHTQWNNATQNWRLKLYFSIDDATTLGTSDFRTIAQNMVDYFDTQWAFPTLSAGTVYANVINTNRFSLISGSPTGPAIQLNSKGTPNIVFQTEAQVGAIDGIYTANSDTTGATIKFDSGQQIEGQTYEFDASALDATEDRIEFDGPHNLVTGSKITYDRNGNTALTNLTDLTDYYAVVIDDVFVKLATSYQDALSEVVVDLSVGSGTHKFKAKSLAGRAEAAGTVSTSENSDLVTGDGTLFRRTYKPGDTIFIKDDANTPGELFELEVLSVPSDTTLQLTSAFGAAISAQKHFSKTAMYARPDGFAVHRPFDGGVEIAAGTAPFSQITRQTRKYFRYQSGKGIQTSLAINFNPPITIKTLTGSGTTATATTQYPHRMETGQQIKVKGAGDNEYNGTYEITVTDEFTFTYTMANTPSSSIPGGIIKFNLDGYSDAATRSGMFDDQNGFFFEYTGGVLNCVRRSSVLQLSGEVSCSNKSSRVIGTDTSFSSQLQVGDMVVIRGMSYRVVNISNNTEMDVQPEYRGTSASGIILTKTEDVKVGQTDWNIDPCDGTGPEGFVLDLDKIQMAYMDYSWYGAGKIRFGFKDRKGHVRYVHEFIHNNRLDEAYMRSGNIPARYEVINGANPSYAPKLFHWGTSVIMDGTFDDDKAYLFTATSEALSFTGGDSNNADTTDSSALVSYYVNFSQRDYYVRHRFAQASSGLFPTGAPLYTQDQSLNGETVSFTRFNGNFFEVYTYVGRFSRFSPPASFESTGNAETVYVGAPPSGNTGVDVDLGTATIPLVSLRLAPSADSSLSGFLGERDILNRMQLKLNEVGLVLSHDCEVKLILNADFSRINWQTVGQPSLSQLQKHQAAETVEGGVEIFNFRASGGSTDNNGVRLSNTQDYKLADLVDLGNSILGGNGVFPNGPDVITVAIKVADTFGISASSPFKASARITWAESQA